MVPRRRQILLRAYMLFDMAVMSLAVGLATLPTLRHVRLSELSRFFSMRIKVGNIFVAVGLLILWHMVFVRFGLYASRRLASRTKEIADVVAASFVASLFLCFAALVFQIRMASPVFLLVFWVTSSSLLIGGRLILRVVLKQTRLLSLIHISEPTRP